MTISSTARAALALALSCAAPFAQATNFAVSGTITVNGNAGTLPSGGTFGNSTYDATTGVLSSGNFTFPQATTSFHSDDLGADVTVTYQLSQSNTSTGQVATDGVAALSHAALKLKVVSAVIGFVPVSFGDTCSFSPIGIDAAGTGSATGLHLSDDGFVIPQVASSACGGYGDQINSGVAGSNNSLTVRIAGDFTPPAPDDDTIFVDGFDGG